jgi:hypothetical protein
LMPTDVTGRFAASAVLVRNAPSARTRAGETGLVEGSSTASCAATFAAEMYAAPATLALGGTATPHVRMRMAMTRVGDVGTPTAWRARASDAVSPSLPL